MKTPKFNKASVLVFVLVAGIHLLLSFLAFTKSAVIHPSALTSMWRVVTEILAFPFIYLSNSFGVVDGLSVLMIGNALLWGAIAALITATLTGRS
jgi:hypothetical protein